MFADKYLQKNNRFPLITTTPDTECGIIVVIPCFREPDILLTLDSLNDCVLPVQKTEVIILINHSEVASEEIKAYNLNTKKEIEDWISNHKKENITFYAVG